MANITDEAISPITAALPTAKLEGFSEDRDFCSSIAEALIRGKIRAAGSKPVNVACFVLAAPSRGMIVDLAAIASRWSGDAVPVAISRSALSGAKQRALREAGIAFFDAAGNAWLEAPGFIIDRRGLKIPNEKSGQRPLHSAGIFSDKATIVSRALLQSRPLGIRELSAAAADAGFPLSPGFVSKVVRSLEERRYIKRLDGKVQLMNRKELIADWAEAYAGMRHPRPQGWYLHAADADSARDAASKIVGEHGVLAGLAAASMIDGFAMFDAVDVYARNLDAVKEALEAAGAVRVERGANVNVSVPRYKVSAFYGSREHDGITTTSDLQTYLDLHLQPRRGREAAEHLIETRLQHLLNDNSTERQGA